MKSEHIASGVRWQIFIEGLHLMTYVGLHAHEYQQQQAVELDIEMSYRPGRQQGQQSDHADSIIDYDQYCTLLSTFMQEKPHTCLLETLASEVASLSFRDYPMLEEIKVAIHKPKIRANAARLGVSACWTRWSYETLLIQQPQEVVMNT
ncbi:dihydroneopterin aldolase [Glaciimonas sp. Gout2]|uniref:dihydroneopterin aldolase n=1 Tax=unclassified Glaciimonas TaxID=2644401 RepID=UPI002AB57ABE|nr:MULTISPECIES: dihydroneopterin aldolase [unclassified Glaciimonas]MDY7547520.1 dihydroneopterin aldolase [Glaciimonas sp. CA11.2]MEB0013488.1 dihydroneopterin aldolase [Glaciimonas sp. Cout2]MEB0081567.1 dihydroneopterin aldolase [Glaciimonas sp. Gout2]